MNGPLFRLHGQPDGARGGTPAPDPPACRCREPASAESLEDRGVGLAAALAHGLQAVPAAAALQLVPQLGGQDGAGGAERVAERDRAAVDVRLLRRRAGLLLP